MAASSLKGSPSVSRRRQIVCGHGKDIWDDSDSSGAGSNVERHQRLSRMSYMLHIHVDAYVHTVAAYAVKRCLVPCRHEIAHRAEVLAKRQCAGPGRERGSQANLD